MYLCSSRFSLFVYVVMASILQTVITCPNVKLRDMAASIIRFVKTLQDTLHLSLCLSQHHSITLTLSIFLSVFHSDR
jgi:hypothetical protein